VIRSSTMSLFDELFDPKYVWDTDRRQRRDIESLRRDMQHAPDWRPMIQAQAERIDRLELLLKGLLELVVSKSLLTRAELSVVMQQLDLADGVEDGRISSVVRETSPRCRQCQRFLNPQRSACVYCGTPMDAAMPPTATASAPRPDVTCVGCGTTVPENETYYSGTGLVCESCFDPSA
jgi:hypothetical protein